MAPRRPAVASARAAATLAALVLSLAGCGAGDEDAEVAAEPPAEPRDAPDRPAPPQEPDPPDRPDDEGPSDVPTHPEDPDDGGERPGDAVPPQPLPDPIEPDADDGAGDDGDGASDPLLGPEVEQVLAEVTDAAGAAHADVEVRVADLVTWPDGALGCPEPDGMYTQALVEGYRIVVAVDGEEWHFHGQQGQAPFRCLRPRPPLDGG